MKLLPRRIEDYSLAMEGSHEKERKEETRSKLTSLASRQGSFSASEDS